VTIDMEATVVRRAARIGAVVAGVSMAMVATPASASPPESWPDPDNSSLLQLVAVLGGTTLVIFAVVTLLVYLPSMMNKQSGEPAHAFQESNEWFGGPRRGVDATAGAPAAQDAEAKGGASARW
jgi:hypothetical protein